MTAITPPDNVADYGVLNPEQLRKVFRSGGRTLETFDDVEAIARANVAGELLPADRAADRLGIRPTDFKHLVRLGWITPADWTRSMYVPKSRAPDMPLYRAGDITALLGDPAIDWDAAQAVVPGRRSPLSKLPPKEGPTP